MVGYEQDAARSTSWRTEKRIRQPIPHVRPVVMLKDVSSNIVNERGQSSPPAHIIIQRLHVTYPVRTGTLTALQDVSCMVATGSFVAVVGPSGCGKSTLLRTVGGLVTPATGTVSIGGLSPEQARLRRLLSFVFQQPVLLPWRTALQNIELPLWVSGWPVQQRRETARHYLDLVGLEQFANAFPAQLSGGMQQRVALARALSFKPAVLLMDEPFGALDELTREHLNGELLRIWSTTNATVLFVTHSLVEAVFLADRILVFSAHPGTLIADMAVELPRPRTVELLDQDVFLRYVAEVRRQLRSA